MSSIIKQLSIKLIPSDPATNTILIIYCVSSTGASVPFKSSWCKINPKRNKVEQINNNNGTSYRCSPLDLDCIIEVTVFFQHQKCTMSRVLQSNVVKLSRELKQKKIYMKEPILCRTNFDQVQFENKMRVVDEALLVVYTAHGQNLSYAIKIKDISIQLNSSQPAFKIIFNQRFQNFVNFAAQIAGAKQKYSNNFIYVQFGSDFNRDIILFGIAQQIQKESGQSQQKFNIVGQNQIGKQKLKILDVLESGHNKNKIQTTFSPTNTGRQKFKLANKFTQSNGSFSNLHTAADQVGIQKKNQKILTSPLAKKETKPQHVVQSTKEKERQYLSVFQEDDLQLLGPPRPVSSITNDLPAKININNQLQKPNSNQQPSINLRGSFEQLEKNFSSNSNEEAFDHLFKIQENQQTKKLQQPLNKLKSENQKLKKQVQSINPLIKQNSTLKKKQQEMKEEINRLQTQRRVILTDKLRCQVNWHKEIQQKEQMKKQIQHLREVMKNNFHNNANFAFERYARTQSIHEVNAFQRRQQNREFTKMNRETNRSPNKSFYR